MIDKRVLITGCGGMLGEATYSVFSRHYRSVLATDIDLNESWLSMLDVRDLKACEAIFAEYKPNIVLHLAAHTDLEYCEKNHEDSWLTNALAPENIGLLCNQYNATMVYISTAGIFGGEQEFYTDFDTPNPLSHYAKSKYYGEQFVLTRVPKSFVFRAGWMMGGGYRKDKKFINKLFRQIQGGATELNVVEDKLGTPTYTYDFANNICRVLDSNYYGLYNQVCGGSCSRYDVAKEMLQLLHLEEKIKINIVDSDFFKSEYFAPRPYSEKLINLKLQMRGLDGMRDWRICLGEYMQKYNEELFPQYS